MTAGTTHDSMTGQRISYEALWLGSNESCEHSHILLTALSQTAQWTGVFMCALVALANPEAFVFLTLGCPVCAISHDELLLLPNFKFCISLFQPKPAHTLHSLNSPLHTGMF